MEGKRGGQTVSSGFTAQLKDLVAMLDATGLHFVRCIKPNAALAPGQLSTDLVLPQLRCCGVLEVARVSRAGYPTRYRWEGGGGVGVSVAGSCIASHECAGSSAAAVAAHNTQH